MHWKTHTVIDNYTQNKSVVFFDLETVTSVKQGLILKLAIDQGIEIKQWLYIHLLWLSMYR